LNTKPDSTKLETLNLKLRTFTPEELMANRKLAASSLLKTLSTLNHSTDLSQYDNSWYNTGAGKLKTTLWYMTNVLFFINPLNPLSGIKVRLLRLFGATIGKGVVIKPGVNIKHPWRLIIGNHTWIGEKVWIDNLDMVTIGSHCCLSQGVLLLCGNHNYKRPTFDLMIAPIVLERWCVAGCAIGSYWWGDVRLPFGVDSKQRGH
jgi:acetyltransferase-like isoleucine patch superfamily enzyme